MDGSGNVVAAGIFEGSVDFGGGSLSTLSRACYLAKLDSAGGHLWSMSFDDAFIGGVDVDSNDNVVITGALIGSVDFGGGTLSAVGDSSAFVAKFDSSGSHLWSQAYHSHVNINYAEGSDVAVDGSDNVILTGYYGGCVEIDLSCVSTYLQNVFLAKLDSSGSLVFAKYFGDTTAWAYPFGVGADASGNIALTGTLDGAIDFGGGLLINPMAQDSFVAEFDSSGNHLWSQTLGSTVRSEGRDIAVDASGNVVLVGWFEGSVDAGGGSLTSAGSSDIFVAQFDDSGTHLWSDSFGGTGVDSGSGVSVDGSGDVYVVGAFSNTVSFGGGSLTSAGSVDAFAAQFDGTGTHIWSAGYGDSSSDGGDGIAVDSSGNVAISGSFQSSINFGGGSLTSAGSTDVFVAQLTP